MQRLLQKKESDFDNTANCSGLLYTDHVNVSENAYSANSKHMLVVGDVYLVNLSRIQGHQIAFEVVHEGVHRWESKILVGASSKYRVIKFGKKIPSSYT